MPSLLSHGQMLELKRWNTPTVYNGWEQVTARNRSRDGINIEPTQDFMPQMGSMVGRAVTVAVEPGNREHPSRSPGAWKEYRRYVASISGPRIVVVQDLDGVRTVGSFWGEVNANVHRALGCVGTITDGAVRDLDEMTNAGFKAIARRLCVGHAWSWPVRWGEPVQVFGQTVVSGTLIHADKHGFLAIEPEAEADLLEAVRFMDRAECHHMIAAARSAHGLSPQAVLETVDTAFDGFGRAVQEKYGRKGEWDG